MRSDTNVYRTLASLLASSFLLAGCASTREVHPHCSKLAADRCVEWTFGPSRGQTANFEGRFIWDKPTGKGWKEGR